MIAEPLQMIVHHRTPKLPFIAMITTFAMFTVVYSSSCRRLLRLIRLFAVLYCRLLQPLSLYGFLCFYLLLCIVAYSNSNCYLSCIKPQRLYKPALRPSQLDRSELYRPDLRLNLRLNYTPTVLGPKVYLKTLTYTLWFMHRDFRLSSYTYGLGAYIPELSLFILVAASISSSFLLFSLYLCIYVLSHLLSCCRCFLTHDNDVFIRFVIIIIIKGRLCIVNAASYTFTYE